MEGAQEGGGTAAGPGPGSEAQRAIKRYRREQDEEEDQEAAAGLFAAAAEEEDGGDDGCAHCARCLRTHGNGGGRLAQLVV